MQFRKSTSSPDLVKGFAKPFREGSRPDFVPDLFDLNAGTKVNYGNYFGIGDLGGKLAASYENSFDPSSVAMNSAMNRSEIQNLVTGNQADMDALGLDAFAKKSMGDKIRADRIKRAKELAAASKKKSTIGLIAAAAGTAVGLAVPGVGPLLAPAVSAGVNTAGNAVT